MKPVLAAILVLLGLAGGAGLGLHFKRAAGEAEAPAPRSPGDAAAVANRGDDAEGGDSAPEPDPAMAGEGSNYIAIGPQIVIPVVEGRETRALMMFEIALDVASDESEMVYALEPRLRDAFLRELFEMSHTGAFMTTYTDHRVIRELRDKLLAAARQHLGQRVRDVLILDVMRQEY